MMTQHPFPAEYELECLEELQAGHTRRLFFPGGTSDGGHDGINVQVSPHEGTEWVGTFALGHFGPRAITGLWTTPNPSSLCVVAEGQGYMVDARNPQQCEAVPIVPVLAVRSSAKYQLLIFSNHTELLAYGSTGIAWRTKRLSWDSLKLTTMSDDELCGVFWDIRSESEQSFAVNLADGTHTGGANVPPTPDPERQAPRG